MEGFSPRLRLRDVAADTSFTAEQLDSLLDDVQHQTPIVEYVVKAREKRESDVELLYRNLPSDLVFGVSEEEWRSIADSAGLSASEGSAARLWHTVRGEDLLRSSGHSDVVDGFDGVLLVVQVPKRELWGWTKPELALWFMELGKAGLTPAEMLDYWVVERRTYSPGEWAESRGVSAEAVRKNVRQAREKVAKTDSTL